MGQRGIDIYQGEDFSDIEVLINYIPPSCYDVKARIFKEEEEKDADL